MANSINLTESGDSSLHRLAALRLDIYHKLTGQCLKWIRKFLSLLKEIKKWCKVEEKNICIELAGRIMLVMEFQ